MVTLLCNLRSNLSKSKILRCGLKYRWMKVEIFSELLTFRFIEVASFVEHIKKAKKSVDPNPIFCIFLIFTKDPNSRKVVVLNVKCKVVVLNVKYYIFYETDVRAMQSVKTLH